MWTLEGSRGYTRWEPVVVLAATQGSDWRTLHPSAYFLEG